jgi:aspartate carbamoyltransferase catalytic subunit
MRSVPIINAGSGSEEHPTQALLDVYTIQRTFQFDSPNGAAAGRLPELRKKYSSLTAGLGHKTYLFCGDLGRGRTVRSLATTLTNFEAVRMFFVSPDHETLKLDAALRKRLEAAGVEFHEFDSLDAKLDGQDILSLIDCLYMTRIQLEHNTREDAAALEQMNLEPFHLSLERVAKLKDYAPILHPFPRDSVLQEIPTAIDADARAMYFRQARNGMWARAALLVHMFDVSDQLLFLYNDFYGS